MELKITGKKENKALQRNELLFKVNDAKVTPSRKEIKPRIAAMLNAKEQLVVIDSIRHPFGSREATVTASVYENEAALKKAGSKHLIERDLGKKKEGKEKQPAKEKEEGKPEKKPAEEKTESKLEEKPAKQGKEKEAEHGIEKAEEKPVQVKEGGKAEEKPAKEDKKEEKGGE